MSFFLFRQVAGWAAFAASLCSSIAAASGLGPVQVQSNLGEPLRASVALLGNDTAHYESRCIKAKISSLDGTFSLVPTVRVTRSLHASNAADSATIFITSRKAINEPALNVAVEASCDSPIHREYQVLLDPAPIETMAPPLVPSKALSLATSARDEHSIQPNVKGNAVSQPRRKPQIKHHRWTEAPTGSSPNRTNKPTENASAERNVLKMSSPDVKVGNMIFATRLKYSDTLSAPSNEPQQTVIQNGEDLTKSAEALINVLREETQTLRMETERIKQERERDKAELKAMRKESRTWIGSLIGLLVLFAASLGWLLWRLHVMKKNASRVSWNELFSDTAAATQLGGHTEFSTTSFEITSMDTDEQDIVRKERSTPAMIHAKSRRTQRFKPAGASISDSPTDDMPDNPTDATLKAEEISDVMDLAETWMTLHDPSTVAKLLEPFSAAENLQSPLPLLCLLDVYRALGEREKYEAIHQRINAIFNVRLTPWDAQPDAPPPRVLADYPHVREQILHLWESDGILTYLDSLLLDSRDGLREGFDLPAYRDILRLKNIAANTTANEGHILDPKAYTILFASEDSEPSMPKTEVVTSGRHRSTEPHARKINLPTYFAERDDMSPMAIKLHLAIAYIDIGDKEGACLLLEEVVQEGTAEQVEQAGKLLERCKITEA